MKAKAQKNRGVREIRMLKRVKIEDAVGMKLAHDLTQIVPGKFKGAAFRRGYRIQKKDIPRLLDMGKKQIFVLNLRPGELHENEAARRMARAVADKSLRLRGPREGKIDFVARHAGLLKIDTEAIARINSIGGLILATRHNHSRVQAGEVVAGTRTIPLTIPDGKVRQVEAMGKRNPPVIEILPFRRIKVGIVVTGSEIYEKRIEDRSAKIVKEKIESFGSRVEKSVIVPDDPGRIGREIQKMKAEGCQVIVTTGGLSVDPDDRTLAGIRSSGAEVVSYGVPVLPGSMSVYARLGKTVILGAPACVVHDPATALDLFLPRVLAGDSITRKEMARLGHGGLCLKCPVCRFPVCPFGRNG
jgi:molybdenum cofactor synthesis domain-containing protein